ncbi:MAG: universal stress protein [Candidatus Promineifilaceae bacterium]
MKILVTVSSEDSEEVIYTGFEFARLTNSSITFLNVIKNPQKITEAQATLSWAVAAAQKLQGGSAVNDIGMQIDTKVRIGHPAEEIIDEAHAGSYDLIVVGTWPEKHVWHRLLAPTTERIVMQARCPVLIAKGKLGPLHHILLCVSGAETHSKAARYLRLIVKRTKGDLKITVLHVMSQISAGLNGQDVWQLEAPAEELIEAATPEGRWLSNEIRILNDTRALVAPRVRHGLVVDELLMEALEGDCDLIVIGAHRQNGWQRFLLDDLSHRIIIRADRPILVV